MELHFTLLWDKMEEWVFGEWILKKNVEEKYRLIQLNK